MASPDANATPSISDLQEEEERIRIEEDEEVERKREAAARLAQERGLHAENVISSEPKQDIETVEEVHTPADVEEDTAHASESTPMQTPDDSELSKDEDDDSAGEGEFVPARLPNFG
jgi:hypothetical protein